MSFVFSINLGNMLLVMCLILSFYVLGSYLMAERGRAISRRVSLAIRATALLLVFATVYLSYLFLTSNFTYMYVWSYSSKALPTAYKLSAVWAGQEGTYLLWALLIFIAILWINERLNLEDALVRRVLMVSEIIGIFFLIMTILVSPFTSIYDLYPPEQVPRNFVPQDGNGLNPLLQDPWMAAHPPVIFIGYAAVTIPFAAALATLWRRDDRWIKIAQPWNRFSWLFLTLGIALGGFWSYKVLGWGGFWAWDPVETSSLIPWFTVTALAHATIRNLRNREFPVLSIALAVVSFWLVLYATFITRSGLWESVHAFSQTTTGPYLAMILVNVPLIPLILGVDFAISRRKEASPWAKALVISFLLAQIAVALVKAVVFRSNALPGVNDVIGIIALTAVLFLSLRNKFESSDERVIPVEEEEEEDRLLTMPNLFYFAIIVLLILGFVAFWGLTYPFIVQALEEQKIKVEVEFFNKWSFPFTVLLLAVLTMCMGYGITKKNELLATLGGAGILSIASYYFKPTPNPIVNVLLPLTGVALAISLYRTVKVATSKASTRVKAERVGYYLIHVGIPLIIFGAMISTTMSTQQDVVFKFVPGQGLIKEVKEVGRGYAVSVEDIRVYQNYEGYTTSEVLVKVYKNGKFIGEGAARSINNLKFGRVTRVYIDRNWDNDVYVIFQGIGEHQQGVIQIPLTVKLEPFVNVLWLGILLLSIGILPSIAVHGFRVEGLEKEKKVEAIAEEVTG